MIQTPAIQVLPAQTDKTTYFVSMQPLLSGRQTAVYSAPELNFRPFDNTLTTTGNIVVLGLVVNTSATIASTLSVGSMLSVSNLSSTTGSLNIAGNIALAGAIVPKGTINIKQTANPSYNYDALVLESSSAVVSTYPSPQASFPGITVKGPTSDGRLMVQDGNGRINDYWNTYYDAAGGNTLPKYIVSNEPAVRQLMSVSGTTGASFAWYGAPAGNAGSSFSWTQIGSMISGTGGSTWFSPRGTSTDFSIDINGNVSIGTSLGITADLTVSGNLTVSGTTTTVNQEIINTSLIDAGTLSVGANATVNALTVNNSVTIGTTLGITGTTTAAAITASGTVQPNSNATVALGGTSNYWGSAYINSLNAPSITGVLQTASQNNITSVGNLTAAGITVSARAAPNANVSIDLGTSGLYWNNGYIKALNCPTITGGTFSGTSSSANYADLAEYYSSDDVYPPGTVLDFGGPAEVTMSKTDMSARIAGVVSTNPAYLMNSAWDGGGKTVAVALTGRVPCLVTGEIRAGDMMVSAGNGYARAESNPKMGSVIGKALTDFSGGSGVIEVVVGRL
jgi:predicted acyltransferase (DUF342 family)